MDLSKLAGSLLSSDSIGGLSGLTGASDKDVSSVLAKALPTLLSGAKDQAKDESTSKGFASALSDHAKDDTSDLSKFLGNVDMKDGAKIISHLLGSGKDDVVAEVAADTGVSKAKTNSILSAAGPLLMSLLGQQTKEEEEKEDGVGGLIGTLLDNVDVGSLLSGLLTDNASTDSKGTKKKAATKKTAAKKTTTKKTTTKKKAASEKESGGLLGSLMKLLK